ncbi:MAG: GH3 auxin-responsive promoter family protein, partial [Cytophagales bacterium]
NVLWPSKIKWFAKSSGTTNSRSKFIPVSEESLEDCHFKGGKDMLSLYINNRPETKVFAGKGLSIGGSHQINHLNPDTFYGDVSAVIMQNLPFWAQIIRTPKLEIALMDKWEEKIERMAESTVNENVTSLSGVPTWTLLLLQRILERTKKKNILEVWPNLEVFLHGAVAFGPYHELFKELIPSNQMSYMEIYNASEGFFGIEDELGTKDMLLMLDYGIYYEFIPFEEFDKEQPQTLTLDQVSIGKNYAMVISTNAGLWRYKIGDTVKFTSLNPFRIKITGRTKHFINAFGEELIIENADLAIAFACKETNAKIDNYTAAPIYLSKTAGGHEWLVEFEQEPDDLDIFTKCLDMKLRELNSDYDAKRQKDLALQMPLVRVLPKNSFFNWLKSKGKLGGQYKIPRLSNDRTVLEEIWEISKQTSNK